MKIEKLIIYGFGKHENVTIELGPAMNVLYGHNEAGKTTIQQFILHILFGFPQRNSSLLRYEPKSGSTYGGQIHIDDQVYGKCIIERVGGKSAGEVVVYFKNGEQGGEEALNNILRQYNRTSFESIFAFSLMQLQGFEKMDEQTLSRTLLASGTTGVDDLLQIEAQMEKEMEALFKKNGRNPALNQKLNELRALEKELQEEQKKVAHYAPAIQRIKEIEEKLATLQIRKKNFESIMGEMNTKRQVLPLHLKKIALASRYDELKTQSFPTDGIQRFETLKNKLAETEATALTIQQQFEEVKQRLANNVEEQKLEHLTRLIEKEAEWHRWLSQVDALKNETRQLEERKSRLLARLGIQTDEGVEILLRADVSIRKEEEMYDLLEHMKMQNREIEQVESKLISLRDEIGKLKEKERLITSPTENELQKAKEWPVIRQQLAEAKAFVSFNHQKQNSSKMFGIAMLLVVLVMAGYGIIERQLSLLFVSVIMAGIAFFVMKKQTGESELQKHKQFIATYEGTEQDVEMILSRVRTYEQETEHLQEKMLDANAEYDRLETIYHEQNEKSVQTEASLQSFLAQYGIDGLPSPNIIPELFRMIRETQETIRQMVTIDLEQQQVEVQISQRIEEGERVLRQSIPREAMYELIRKAYHLHVQAFEEQQRQMSKKDHLEKQYKETTALIQLLKNQIQTLFADAYVKTEEAYYEADSIQREKESLQTQMMNIDLQLAVNGDVTVDSTVTDADLVKRLADINREVEQIDKEVNMLLDEKAMLTNQTNQLLTDETYAKLQQQFEMERATFAELAKEWASKKALASAIRQMMNELKEKKFPHVLQEAAHHFQRLTGGQYKSIVITEQGYFEAVSKRGMHYPIIELSQATKEQAYISLRLALASSVFGTAPFPIIMDDPFVHFDESRLSHIIELLAQLTEHQFIYFTCHEEMKNCWQQATTINVSTIGSKRGANV